MPCQNKSQASITSLRAQIYWVGLNAGQRFLPPHGSWMINRGGGWPWREVVDWRWIGVRWSVTNDCLTNGVSLFNYEGNDYDGVIKHLSSPRLRENTNPNTCSNKIFNLIGLFDIRWFLGEGEGKSTRTHPHPKPWSHHFCPSITEMSSD